MAFLRTTISCLPVFFLLACNGITSGKLFSTAPRSLVNDESSFISAEEGLRSLEQKSVAARAKQAIITGIGYATVSGQPSKDVNEKRLMAIRAARLGAYRDLAEQIHGMRVDSQTTIIDALVQNDSLRAKVSGTIRGAKTVRINPVGSDNYEVVLELDRRMILDLVTASM